MKNLKKQLAAATAVAALAAVPALAGAPTAQQPGANVGYVLSQVPMKERGNPRTRLQRHIANSPAVMIVTGFRIGYAQDGLLGGLVGAA